MVIYNAIKTIHIESDLDLYKIYWSFIHLDQEAIREAPSVIV